MASKNQITGMRGVYLVAAELSRLGFIVSPTSRSANTADLLITDATCRNVYAVQVKTNAVTFGFWLVNKNTSGSISDQLVYVLVNLRKKKDPEFYVVPSKIVAQKVVFSAPSQTRKSIWYSVYLNEVAEYKDRWDLFRADAIVLEASETNTDQSVVIANPTDTPP